MHVRFLSMATTVYGRADLIILPCPLVRLQLAALADT